MALRITTGLIKFKNLQKDLGLSLYATIGLLESLWHFTVSNAIQGNVGKHSNQEIADWIGWEGDADKMIEALTNRRWLDRHSVHRLIVHDWHLHADKSVRTTLKNRRIDFVMPEVLTNIPEKNIGNPVLDFGGPPGAGAEYGAESGPEYGAGTAAPACVADFPVEVQGKADEIFQRRWFDLKGCLPNYERQDARQELREIADKICSQSDAYEKLKGYFAGPPPPKLGRTPKLWMIFKYLKMDGQDAKRRPETPDNHYSGLQAPTL